ncbi:MAG: CPBP family intramembrane metalloprotease [Bacteroidales bacterium]|jgi:membrane protease YdiL (CAAX protease family)|nr:CPBP family intramembrane metalloprotease [Bacteroidales bacterium]
MKNNKEIIYGTGITIAIFLISTLVGKSINIDSKFFSSSITTHLLMLILSICAIFIFKRQINFKIKLPKFKTIFTPILAGLLITILVNIIMSITTIISGGNISAHSLVSNMNFIQLFISVFILASIAEELLFRGFLQNMLASLNKFGIKLFKIRLSLPVIISALMFGLAHIIIAQSGADFWLVLRTVIFTTVLGLAAGYYQEKYNNSFYAIIVHMAGNLPALISSLLMM